MLQTLKERGRSYVQSRKGATELFNWVLSAGAILIVIGIFAFVIATLDDAITNATVTSIYNNTLNMFDNFTAQLPTVGTLAGVLLILGLLAVVGLGVYVGTQRMRGGGF